jgi:hypothetical protein
MAKVFISHRGADSSSAARLKSDLEILGHSVWLDKDEIRAGDSIIQKMNDGLTEATHVVVMYSDNTSPGLWMDREWMSALARVLNGFGVKLIPVRIGLSTGPSILADVKYADLYTDWASGMRNLESALL